MIKYVTYSIKTKISGFYYISSDTILKLQVVWRCKKKKKILQEETPLVQCIQFMLIYNVWLELLHLFVFQHGYLI